MLWLLKCAITSTDEDGLREYLQDRRDWKTSQLEFTEIWPASATLWELWPCCRICSWSSCAGLVASVWLQLEPDPLNQTWTCCPVPGHLELLPDLDQWDQISTTGPVQLEQNNWTRTSRQSGSADPVLTIGFDWSRSTCQGLVPRNQTHTTRPVQPDAAASGTFGRKKGLFLFVCREIALLEATWSSRTENVNHCNNNLTSSQVHAVPLQLFQQSSHHQQHWNEFAACHGNCTRRDNAKKLESSYYSIFTLKHVQISPSEKPNRLLDPELLSDLNWEGKVEMINFRKFWNLGLKPQGERVTFSLALLLRKFPSLPLKINRNHWGCGHTGRCGAVRRNGPWMAQTLDWQQTHWMAHYIKLQHSVSWHLTFLMLQVCHCTIDWTQNIHHAVNWT